MSQLSPLQRHLIGAVVFIAAIAIIPLFLTQRYYTGEIILFMLWASVAIQWNVLLGHAGVFSLGQMLFFGIGAYAVGMVGVYLDTSPWLSLPVGALVAAIVALLIGLACLRLEAAYVALLTFAIVFMVQTLILSDSACYSNKGGYCQPFFGGGNGFSSFDDFGFRKLLKGKWLVGNFYVVLGLLSISLVASIIVIHGRLGLAFRTLGDSRVYAAARGINRTKFHIIAFVITAFLTGLTGAVHAGHFRFAGPSLFEFSTLVFILSMIVVGGLRTTWGPVFGAIAMSILVEISKDMGDVRNTTVGIVLILFVLLLPRGIVGAAASLRDRLLNRNIKSEGA